MFRRFTDLIAVNEVEKKFGLSFKENIMAENPNKVIVIKRGTYLKKEVFTNEQLEVLTDLSFYVQPSTLNDLVGICEKSIRKKIHFMEEFKKQNNSDNLKGVLFDYTNICGKWFIKLDEEFLHLLETKIAFVANFDDAKNMTDMKLLGDIKVGFY